MFTVVKAIVIRLIGLAVPYLGQVLGIITGIEWTWKKVGIVLGICALLYSGYSLYNSGYQSCRLEVEKQQNEKSKIKTRVRNSAVDRDVICNGLSKNKF